METVKMLINQATSVPLVKQFLLDLVGKKCFKSLFVAVNLQDTVCLRLALSKVLGTGIVVGAGMVKVPQILKILASKSTKGLSLSSYLLETIVYCISLAYNIRNKNPFSTYGENAFITVQNLIILVLMHSFAQKNFRMVLILLIFAGFYFALSAPWFINAQMLQYLQAATIPVGLLSKIPQIVTNFQEQSTGQLSLITVFLFFFGSLARVFTTLQEVKDSVLLWGFALATVFNGILAFQMIYYWNSSGEGKAEKKSKKKQ